LLRGAEGGRRVATVGMCSLALPNTTFEINNLQKRCFQKIDQNCSFKSFVFFKDSPNESKWDCQSEEDGKKFSFLIFLIIDAAQKIVESVETIFLFIKRQKINPESTHNLRPFERLAVAA
jgi:hypothetical protein